MSDFEFLAGAVSAVLAIRVWWIWYADLAKVNRFGARRSIRIVAGLVPVVSLLIIVTVIPLLAARAVRESLLYTIFYIVLGAAWVGAASLVVPYLGICLRDDVLERRNGAAAWPFLAAIVAFALCYTGGNIGEGPGPEAVIASAGLATLGLLSSWLILEVLSGNRVSEAISVERDLGSGFRLTGFLLAAGIVLGKAAAGDWSPGTVISSFVRVAWPLIILIAISALVERTVQQKLTRSLSAVIAIFYVSAATLYVWPRVSAR